MPTLATQGKQHRALVSSLNTLGFADLASRVNQCGRVRIYKCTDCNHRAGLVVMRCKYRLCPYCASLTAHIAAKAKESLLRDMTRPHLITLSLPASHNLKDAHNALRDCWKDISQTAIWKDTFSGGLVHEEVQHTVRGWRVHFHIIAEVRDEVEDDNLPAMLSNVRDQWAYIVPMPGAHSHITRIDNLAPDAQEQLFRAARYPHKPPHIHRQPDLVKEWMSTIKGARMRWAWGTCLGQPTQEVIDASDELGKDPDDPPVNQKEYCPHCGSHDTMRPDQTRANKYKYWSRWRCKPTYGGWYNGPPPPLRRPLPKSSLLTIRNMTVPVVEGNAPAGPMVLVP